MENTVGNPLEDPPKLCETYMYPEPFPPAKDIIFETIEGDIVALSVERKPYPSFEESFFTNINFPALQIKFYVSEKMLIQGLIIRLHLPRQSVYLML